MLQFIKNLFSSKIVCFHDFEMFDYGSTEHCRKCNRWRIRDWNGHWKQVDEEFINKVLRGRR
jgi:hypothetical protein